MNCQSKNISLIKKCIYNTLPKKEKIIVYDKNPMCINPYKCSINKPETDTYSGKIFKMQNKPNQILKDMINKENTISIWTDGIKWKTQ